MANIAAAYSFPKIDDQAEVKPLLPKLATLWAGERAAREAMDKAVSEYTAARIKRDAVPATSGDPIQEAAAKILAGDTSPPSAALDELARLAREASATFAAHQEARKRYERETLDPARSAARTRLAAEVRESVWESSVRDVATKFAAYQRAAIDLARLKDAIHTAGLFVPPCTDPFPTSVFGPLDAHKDKLRRVGQMLAEQDYIAPGEPGFDI